MSDTLLRILHVASHLFLITDYKVGFIIITFFFFFLMRRVNPGEVKWCAENPMFRKQLDQDLSLNLTTSVYLSSHDKAC